MTITIKKRTRTMMCRTLALTACLASVGGPAMA